jgi:hypothetical protein
MSASQGGFIMICAEASGVSRRSSVASDGKDRIDPSERLRLERVVPDHISRYFESAGVPEGVDIHDKRYVDMCIETSICEATDMAYRALAGADRFSAPSAESSIAEDVRMVIGILRGIRQRCIPQEFSAGILLMHLEILEGVPFSSEI